MSAPTDTPPLTDAPTWIREEHRTAERVCALVTDYGLPMASWAGRGRGTAVLRAAGPWPLDDLLAWAGEMTRAPHWWVLARPSGLVDVHAAGYVHGLAVSIAAPTSQPLPARVTTDHVIAAAASERAAHAAQLATAGPP